jgi:8-oxo-dGTP pyrophosphatase MutT (NUDIX family)
MSAPMIKQLPLKLHASQKRDVRSQFAALCYRVQNGRVEVLLITSRRSKRWIVPKGWPIDEMTPAQSAAREAWEEAGVIGKPVDICLGLFSYRKVMEDAETLPCVAMVYPVKVKKLAKDYPEAGERKRRWVSRKKAAQMVSEPELSRILRDFDPRLLG